MDRIEKALSKLISKERERVKIILKKLSAGDQKRNLFILKIERRREDTYI